MQCVRHCDSSKASKRALFNQPVLQTAQMFVGEMGCWIVVALMALYRKTTGNNTPADRGYEAVNTLDADGEQQEAEPAKDSVLRGWRVTLLALPAICDILGTTLMNAGLLLVAASIYQMTRGALVLFVGLFSVVFLRRHLHLFQWLALVGVVTGVAIVGLAGAIWPDEKPHGETSTSDEEGLTDAGRAIVGVLLIAGAQIFTATQFVLEEWMLERSPIEPLQVVGWEGLFGFTTTVVGMFVLHYFIGSTDSGRYGPFDLKEGWRQMTEIKTIWSTSIFIMISIG